MTVGRYLVGVALVACALAPAGVGAVRLRRRLAPGWVGSPARVAEAVIGLMLLYAVLLGLGVLGALRLGPLVGGCVLLGAAAALLGRGPGSAVPRASGGERPEPLAVLVALGVSALLAGQWGARVLDAVHEGMTDGDTLSYHGPLAARFVQEHSITQLQFVYSDPLDTFAPANSELLHTGAFLFFGRDLLSPGLNLAWLALALLAAWCIGRSVGVGPASLSSVALVLGSSSLLGTQPGGAENDIVTIALFLSAAALLLHAEGRKGPLVLAAVAAGLALGTKVTMIAPVILLGAGVVISAPQGSRVRVAGLWTVPVLAAGGFWYLRNLVHTGSPLPGAHLHLGPLALPSVPAPRPFSVAHYAIHADQWRDHLLPELHSRFGPAWWAVLGLALAGMVLSLAAGSTKVQRMLGATALVSCAVWAVSPRTGGAGYASIPNLFGAGLRYLTSALALGLALLPLVPRLTPLARRWWAPAALGVLLLVNLAHPTHGRSIELGAIAALFALGAMAVLRLRWRPAVTLSLVTVAALMIATGWMAQRTYSRGRYAHGSLAWARDLRGTRIAVAGGIGSYSLFGSDLSNRVEEVARRGRHGALVPIASCREWRRALARGKYRYVVTSPRVIIMVGGHLVYGSFFGSSAPEATWTRSAPAASEVRRGADGVSVFQLDGTVTAGGCGRGPRPTQSR